MKKPVFGRPKCHLSIIYIFFQNHFVQGQQYHLYKVHLYFYLNFNLKSITFYFFLKVIVPMSIFILLSNSIFT